MKDIRRINNARQDTSHSSRLTDSRSWEANHELFRAHDVKSTVTLKTVGCCPVRSSMDGINATSLAAPRGFSRHHILNLPEDRVGHITALGDCL